MRRYEQVVISLQDGRQLCVTIRELPWWRLVLRIVINTCGLLAILAGCLLLWSGFKDSAVFAAVAGFGLFAMGKE